MPVRQDGRQVRFLIHNYAAGSWRRNPEGREPDRNRRTVVEVGAGCCGRKQKSLWLGETALGPWRVAAFASCSARQPPVFSPAPAVAAITPAPPGFAPPRFDWPVASGRLSSRFGLRHGAMHEGVDIAAPVGTPVRAAGAGRVIFVGRMRGYGNLVIVQHDRRYVTVYAHESATWSRKARRSDAAR